MSENQSHREIMSANQSRRLVDPDPSPVSSTNRPDTDNPMPYPGRELAQDSMRLVEIEPATHESDPVVCTLRDVAFGSRPEFEALSYRWGTEPANDTITLNGCRFEVKKNLLDALLFLRRRVAPRSARQSFWIDAICINQRDVSERNSQLRIMGQIYFRADTVVVWLGSEYTKFQKEKMGELKPNEGEKPEEDTSSHDNSIQKKMVRELRTDPYWDRLWIIQEIAQANKLRVCFGDESFSWKRFMHLIAMHHSDGNTGPLRLDRQLREEKYNDSLTLKRLLEEHGQAKCLDPRDKVYGLVGLASDAAEFPMDYSKSLYEVWKDTMVYMNQWKLFKEESQILTVGALVKSLLMEKYGDPLSQILKEHEDHVDSTQLIDNPTDSLVFCLEAISLGCILCVGPSASDVVLSPRQASGWRTEIQRFFPADELVPAHREYDEMLRALLKSNDSEVETMCFNRPSTVVWKLQRQNSPWYVDRYHGGYQRRVATAASQLPRTPQQAADRLASVQPRLYLASQFPDRTPRKMGVASGLVQPSDLVCWVRSSRRALLVRVVEEDDWCAKVRVLGTALATEDMRGSTPDLAQRWMSLREDAGARFQVQLDADTIFMLLE